MPTALYDAGQYDVDVYDAATTLAPTPITDGGDVAASVDLLTSTATLVPLPIPAVDDLHAPPLGPDPVLVPVGIESVGDVTQVGLALLTAPLTTLVPESIDEPDDIHGPAFLGGPILTPVPIEPGGDVTASVGLFHEFDFGAIDITFISIVYTPTIALTVVTTPRVFVQPVTYTPRIVSEATP